MACKTSYELYHNFPKLAEESGFTFNTHRPRVHIDWSKIRLLDIDNLIRDRKFILLEQQVNTILDCILESEFDVRILDEGVVKMFRLAQLTIEYQQFCRHYLDRSVHVLRGELANITQELDSTKRDLRERDDEIRKLKRKSKHNYRPPILYGNENIANMILKTLSNNGEFKSSSLLDTTPQYNKCNYCEKIFLNQLYLKSHMSRRHANVSEIPQRDFDEQHQDSNVKEENSKLNNEIIQLKCKLEVMENVLMKLNTSETPLTKVLVQSNEVVHPSDCKDVEVQANSESDLLKKIEQWKKEEQEKYALDIESLKTQIIETIGTIKAPATEITKGPEEEIIQKLNSTISEQGQQIELLKEAIVKNNKNSESKNVIKQSELETQIGLWMQKVEIQTKQYELLVQNLNEVAKEAQEARNLAESESKRAAYLQALLEKRTSVIEKQDSPNKYNIHTTNQVKSLTNDPRKMQEADRKPTNLERRSLEELHLKAQELLNMNSSSSSSSDVSIQKQHSNNFQNETHTRSQRKITHKTKNKITHRQSLNIISSKNIIPSNTKSEFKTKPKKVKIKRDNNLPVPKENGPVIPRSPIKVVRAKVTEEVSNRLAAAGVDPLKKGLRQTVYNKQRLELQQEQRLKSKRNPHYEKVRHSILTYLDSKAGVENDTSVMNSSNSVSPTKSGRGFSISSILSNVKNKALKLVQTNELRKNGRQPVYDIVAKKASSLVKTPPGSAPSSPPCLRHASIESKFLKPKLISQSKTKKIINKDKFYTANSKNHDKEKPISQKILSSKEADNSLDSDIETESNTSESSQGHDNAKSLRNSSKSIENLIKSPVRRPSTANGFSDYSKVPLEKNENFMPKTQSAINITELKHRDSNDDVRVLALKSSSMDIITRNNSPLKKKFSEENIQLSPKQAKGVLKNAPSTSSLNKKKVLFDLDAIQMKSVSASPSQSTEKSDSNEKYDLGLINLDDDEWDLSSIDNEPLKSAEDQTTKFSVSSRTTPKIMELKQSIESQLARRNETPSTMLVGGIDVLKGPASRVASVGGSNTSLGSSMLDDTDNAPTTAKTSVTPKIKKDDSELDLSEFSLEGPALTAGTARRLELDN